MSKHSKWAKVKNYKGTADSKRAGVFTKLGRAITVAVKQGGADPSMNFHLRLAIEKAREANMPKDTIERAVSRGSGVGEGVVIEEVLYEGFGPGGAAILVHALTDNKNRTLMNVRLHFSKMGGSLGAQNSVAWMFEKKGVLRVQRAKDSVDDQTLRLIDDGATDVQEEDDALTVFTTPGDFEQVKKRIEERGMIVDFAEVPSIAKEKFFIADEATRQKIEALIEALEEDEDVDEVVTNWE